MNKEYSTMSFKEIMAKQYTYLDQIPFEPYIDKYDDLDDLWNAVENDYDDTEITHNDFLDGWIFNWINHYELSKYLAEKYKVNYREETLIKYYKCN